MGRKRNKTVIMETGRKPDINGRSRNMIWHTYPYMSAHDYANDDYDDNDKQINMIIRTHKFV